MNVMNIIESNKSFTIYNVQNKTPYYIFFENIVKSTIFKKKIVQEPNDNVIYSKDFIITFENPILEKYCKLFCIMDNNDKKRFFVGININTHNYSYAFTGLFLYFDKDKVIDMIIVPEILKSYDITHYSINEDNTILYNQSLVLIENNQKVDALRITVVCFDYYDKYLGKHTDYTTIKGPYNIRNLRWIEFKDSSFLDMGSVCIEFNKLKYNIYQMVTNIDLLNKPEEYYGDNYPLYCPKCNIVTSIANFTDKISETIHRFINLGNSYCHNCSIRYSLSRKEWLCCKLINNDFCSNKVDSNYSCNFNHTNIKLVYIDSYSGKKPYKNILELFIVKL